MAKKKWAERQVNVAGYRVTWIVVFGVTAAIGVLLAVFGEALHKRLGSFGEAREGQIQSAIWVFTSSFILPVAAGAGAFLTVRGWEERKNDKIFLWQAILATVAFIGTCLLIVLVVGHTFLFADWAVPTPEKGPLPAVQFPKGFQPGERLEWFFGNCGSLFLTACLAFGVLMGKGETEQNSQAAAQPQQPKKPKKAP